MESLSTTPRGSLVGASTAAGLGFRGLFILIGLVFVAAFLIVSVPHLVLRWEAMRGAEGGLEAIRQTKARHGFAFAE